MHHCSVGGKAPVRRGRTDLLKTPLCFFDNFASFDAGWSKEKERNVVRHTYLFVCVFVCAFVWVKMEEKAISHFHCRKGEVGYT